MAKIKLTEQMLDKISSLKEVLSTMPVNNEKNVEKYKQKLRDLIIEYTKYESELEKALNTRYDIMSNVDKSNDIDFLAERLSTIEDVFYLFEDKKSSYQKMKLDRCIYIIGKFYKENLEKINIQIYECIQKFKKVGIEITLQDFDYSVYVKQYMEVFLKEIENKQIYSGKLKAKFEEIYWKCPDIIIHIELNIRSIYLSKQQLIDKHFEKEKQELMKKWNKDASGIWKTYMELKKQKHEKEDVDKKLLMNKFENELKYQDYENTKIQQKCKEIVNSNDKDDIKINVFKFLNSLYEYKGAMEFDFIVKDIKTIYNEKGNYKKAYNETKKNIETLEKKMKKNSKATGLLRKTEPSQDKLTKQNDMILELKQMYKQLDQNEFALKVEDYLNDASTIEDVLNLANSNYYYMVNCQLKNDNTIAQDQIEENIKKLIEFLRNPYHTIINNMPFIQEKDMAIIIKDRYKLMNFKIEKEDITLDNVDNMISTLEQIKTAFCLQDAQITFEELEELTELKKVLKK